MGIESIKSLIANVAYQTSMLRCLITNCADSELNAGSTSDSVIASTPRASILKSSGEHDSCPINVPWSCSTSDADTCCYEGRNGLFLLTQFWDYSPATGPDDLWTIHGLWSDKCTGGYSQFCNPSWAIKDAKTTLESLGMDDLVSQMSTVWKNQGRPDDDLWTHEFNKHGTCMSTVNPGCYPSDAKDQNVGDFFKRVVALWETLPSYEWLKSAGIEPSTDKTWTVAEFSDALVRHTNGKNVYLGCDRRNAINEIWYFFSLKGSVADGEFDNIDTITTSSCTDGFRYLPKGSGNGGGGGGDNDEPSQRGNLKVYVKGSSTNHGCLISDGSWFTSGTCATFRVTESVGGVSVRSSRGLCGVVSNSFKCGPGVTGSDFELKDGVLTYGGESIWSADSVPKRNQKIALDAGTDGPIEVSIQLK